jgi:GTPase SAR1 family protein
MESKDVLVLVYDTTSRQSFQDISGIFNAHRQLRDVIIVLVGNKTDLRQQRQVQHHEGLDLARKLGAHFWEVSALNGESINEMLRGMVSLVPDRQDSDSDEAMQSVWEETPKGFWEKTPKGFWEKTPRGFWKNLVFVFQSCMGKA